MARRLLTLGVVTAVTLGFVLGGLVGTVEAGNPYAKYKGTTIVVNWPSHAHYDAVMRAEMISEFTKLTGIKVEVDKLQYMRMHEKQLLEMSKPKGDYDIISYGADGIPGGEGENTDIVNWKNIGDESRE